MRRRLLVLAGVLTLLSVPALAESTPRSGPLDRRIRFVSYNPDDVIVIEASYGASTMIVFQDDEKIETLAAGDAMAWKVEPNKRGNVLFVKPVDKNTNANLNVLTSKRSYVFVLRAAFRPVAQQVFKVVFRYPDDEADKKLLEAAKERASQPLRQTLDVANANSRYAYKGSSANKPLTVFDDGKKTWFRFEASTPAIFAVDGERNESLVNHHREGEYVIVDKVNFQWTLRSGEEVTCVFNLRLNDLNEPTGLEPYAPQRVGQPAQNRVVRAGASGDAISK
jgi:type IV secretion system protein VirB9